MNRVTAHTLQCASICAWLLCGLTGLGQRCLLVWLIQDKREKWMGTIHRLWLVTAVTESRAWARRSQMRLFAVRCQSWMGVGGLQKLSRGKSRGTAGEPEV